MANNSRYKMSQARLDELKKELKRMETEGANEVAEQIKEARSYGDLSENSEYDEAKNEQAKLYSKIAEHKDLIEHAQIIDDEAESIESVLPSTTVTILDIEMDEELTYRIVGSQEADPFNGMISDESPIGRTLLHHRVGEEVAVETPGGVVKFRIISISK